MVGINRQKYYRSFWITSEKQSKVNTVLSLVNEVRLLMPRIGTRKLYHMLITAKRNYRKTTESHHRFYKHKNLIEHLSLERPEQVWVSDITYIGGRDKNCYLALITDAYSKKIVGYDLSDSLAADGSLRALNMAIKERRYNDPLIHHSDRGLQYCSNDYQKRLKKKNIIPSMTESYDPYANAIAERVNGILKQEFLLEEYHVDLQTMKRLVEDSIRIYNTLRPHWSCYMKTPNEMHRQRNVKIKTYKKQSGNQVNLITG